MARIRTHQVKTRMQCQYNRWVEHRYELHLNILVCPYYQLHHSSEFSQNGNPGDPAVDFDSAIIFNLLPCCILMRFFTGAPSKTFSHLVPLQHSFQPSIEFLQRGLWLPADRWGPLKAVMKYWSPELTDSHKKAMALRVSAEKEEQSLFLSHVEMSPGSTRL